MNRLLIFFVSLVIFGCNSQKSYMVNSYEDYFPSSNTNGDNYIVDKNYDNSEPSNITYSSKNNNDIVDDSDNGSEVTFSASASISNDNVDVSAQAEIDNVDVDENVEVESSSTGRKSVCKAKIAPGPRKVGKPYVVGGIKYYPISSADGFSETGIASWYGPGFHGKLTANGEKYNQKAMTAAHKTLPLPTFVRVENLENGKEIVVRVNDRGPFSKGRIIDLTEEGARRIGMLQKGTARVRISVLSEEEDCYVSGGKEIDLNSGNFAVQIGAFSVRDNATRLAERFKGRVEINAGYNKGVLLYRVWITGYTSKKEAEAAAENYGNEFAGAFAIAK